MVDLEIDSDLAIWFIWNLFDCERYDMRKNITWLLCYTRRSPRLNLTLKRKSFYGQI